MRKYNLIKDNLETLEEFYSMDTREVQFKLQNFYYKFENMEENGDSKWSKVFLDKKRIIWTNPLNGFAVAAMKDVNTEITLPNALPTFQENFEIFNSLWLNLDYEFEILITNILSHKKNQEYCCLDCSFPFAPVCSELYTIFDPDETWSNQASQVPP